jgi:phage terminase small subunit
MEGSGRKSASSLSVAPVAAWDRLEPPDSLNDEEKATWRAVCATKPADWWKADSAPLLEAYCKAISHYRVAAERLDSIDPEMDISAHAKLITAVATQARLMCSLATDMRLTQQSRYTDKAAGTADRKAGVALKPWAKMA